MATAEAEWFGPNQTFSVRRQLVDGVRALMLDTHYDEAGGSPVPSLCHAYCALGSRPLDEGLAEIERFLTCNPDQVVTLILEAYISDEDTRAAFEASGLLRYAHAQDREAPWPTLETLISTDRRLVVLSDEGGPTGWHMDVWRHAFETPFSAMTIDDLTCVKNRGDKDNALFILNHFLGDPLPSPELARIANANPFLQTRVEECVADLGRRPNFLTVDFYELGDALEVVRRLNAP